MFIIYKMFNIGRQCKMYFTESRNISFFYKNIWSCQKKVVSLHKKLKNINNHLKNSQL